MQIFIPQDMAQACGGFILFCLCGIFLLLFLLFFGLGFWDFGGGVGFLFLSLLFCFALIAVCSDADQTHANYMLDHGASSSAPVLQVFNKPPDDVNAGGLQAPASFSHYL